VHACRHECSLGSSTALYFCSKTRFNSHPECYKLCATHQPTTRKYIVAPWLHRHLSAGTTLGLPSSCPALPFTSLTFKVQHQMRTCAGMIPGPIYRSMIHILSNSAGNRWREAHALLEEARGLKQTLTTVTYNTVSVPVVCTIYMLCIIYNTIFFCGGAVPNQQCLALRKCCWRGRVS
jgi:hypothetical protein